MNKKANFMLPGSYEHFDLYQQILTYISKNPEVLRENANIYCVYGNIPFCTWDGGRIFSQYKPATSEFMVKMREMYNTQFNVKIRFIFTNNLIEENDCYDRYNNLVLDIFNNGQNEIVVNSPVLEKYLLEKYPNYNYISSTTKCLSNTQDSKNEINQDQYKFICLDYNLNHNKKFLNSLTEKEKEKVEFLVNPICGPGCIFRKEHYRLNSLYSLTYGKMYKMRGCYIDGNILSPHDNWPTIITPDEIYGDYFDNGFTNFKLEGRTLPDSTVALIFTKYLIKPKFQFSFLDDILSGVQGLRPED